MAVLRTDMFTCPSCRLTLKLPEPGAVVCGTCGWRGEAYLFSPIQTEIRRAESARPDDATCIHHPSKRATATCSGTGDYICALCAVEIKGKTYSVQYLENAGKQKVTEAYAPVLPRPDRVINLYLLTIFIPGVNYVTIPLAPLWVAHAFVLRARAKRMRDNDPMYARLVSRLRISVHLIVLVLVLIVWIGAALVMISAALSDQN